MESSKCRQPIRGLGKTRRLYVSQTKSVLKLSVSDDGVQAFPPLLLFFLLDLQLIRRLTARYAETDSRGGILGFPSTTAGRFADDAGPSQGIGIQFAKGGLEIGGDRGPSRWKWRPSGAQTRRIASEMGAPDGKTGRVLDGGSTNGGSR